MNVFAEYMQLPNGQEFRKKTLLQFGNSTNLIGSAILINPGSAAPVNDIDDYSDTIKSFYMQNHQVILSESKLGNWKVFSADPTMRFLTKIFNGDYIGHETKLEGIIQLFNCSYYKEQNLGLARENMLNYEKFTFNEAHLLSNKPVYFGWGNEGKEGSISKIAEDIFKLYDLSLTPIYFEEFSDNSFYHPNYINRSYKSNVKTQKLLKDFYALFY